VEGRNWNAKQTANRNFQENTLTRPSLFCGVLHPFQLLHFSDVVKVRFRLPSTHINSRYSEYHTSWIRFHLNLETVGFQNH
jgi:hypothetical protein